MFSRPRPRATRRFTRQQLEATLLRFTNFDALTQRERNKEQQNQLNVLKAETTRNAALHPAAARSDVVAIHELRRPDSARAKQRAAEPAQCSQGRDHAQRGASPGSSSKRRCCDSRTSTP